MSKNKQLIQTSSFSDLKGVKIMTKNINPEKIVVEVQPESMKLVIYGHTRNGISYSGGSSSTTLVTVKLDYE